MLHLRPSNCWRHDNGGESRDARFHKRHGRGYSSGTILHARRCADQGRYVRGPTRPMHFGALSSQCARSACVWRRSYNSGLARWHPRCSLIADFAGAFMQRSPLSLLPARGWLVADQLKEAPNGEFWQAATANLLMIHGAAAMIALLLLGGLFPSHIVRAWRGRLNRMSGSVMVFCNTVLIVTAFGLYYLGSECQSALEWVP